MSQSTADRFGLGGVDQIGYVVADLETSMPHHEALFGPFQVGEAPLDGVRFRGEEISCKLKVATNNDGPVEIELINIFFKRFGPGIAFSYMESPRELGGALIELFEVS